MNVHERVFLSLGKSPGSITAGRVVRAVSVLGSYPPSGRSPRTCPCRARDPASLHLHWCLASRCFNISVFLIAALTLMRTAGVVLGTGRSRIKLSFFQSLVICALLALSILGAAGWAVRESLPGLLAAPCCCVRARCGPCHPCCVTSLSPFPGAPRGCGPRAHVLLGGGLRACVPLSLKWVLSAHLLTLNR